MTQRGLVAPARLEEKGIGKREKEGLEKGTGCFSGSSCFYGSLLGVFLLAFLVKRSTATGWGLIAGMLSVVLFSIFRGCITTWSEPWWSWRWDRCWALKKNHARA